jgi:type I site-specific restriction-modification system R (restriction) subunit
VADRKILDEQLGDTVLSFLSANGIGDVQRSKSSDHLAALMHADRPRVIITTMQKFIKLGKVSQAANRRFHEAVARLAVLSLLTFCVCTPD